MWNNAYFYTSTCWHPQIPTRINSCRQDLNSDREIGDVRPLPLEEEESWTIS